MLKKYIFAAVTTVVIAMIAIAYTMDQKSTADSSNIETIDPTVSSSALQIDAQPIRVSDPLPVMNSVDSSDDSLAVMGSTPDAETASLPPTEPNRPSQETLDKFGSQKSQDMFASRLQDREGFFEWVALKYEEGLTEKDAVARNEAIVAKHIENTLADTNIALTLSCSKSVCFIDIDGGRDDVREFASAFAQGWPATDDFMSTFSGYRLEDGTNRTVLYLEDI